MHILKNLKKAAFWIDYGLQDYWIRHKLKKLNQEDAVRIYQNAQNAFCP